MTDFKISDDLVLLGASTFGAAKDAQMHRDAADIIAQRRGANPQEWRLYDRFVSLSDYDRLNIYIGGGPAVKTIEFEADSSDATQGINIVMESLANAFGDGSITLRAGTSGATLFLAPAGAGAFSTLTSTQFSTTGNVIFAGNLRVSGAGPHSIAGAPFGAVQLLIGETFTSSGASNIASGLFHSPTIVGAPGDTSALTGTTLTAGITTQTATESIANIAQLQVNEPFITNNLTGTITQASTVLITGAPTEATRNYALNVEDGSVRFGLAGPHVIGGVPQNFVQYAINGTFTSGGSNIQAAGLRLSTNLVGASGDTLRLAGMDLAAIITTQSATESITDVAQLSVTEPNITDNLTGSITNASTVLILGAPTEGSNNFALRVTSGATFLGGKVKIAVSDSEALFIQKAGGGGPGQDILKVDTSASGFPPGNLVRLIGASFLQETASGRNTFGTSTAFDYVFLRIAPSQVISGGASDEAHILLVEGNIQGFSGDTARINVATFTGSVTTQNVAEAVANISQVQIDEPAITLQGSSTVTNAQSLLITDVPTEGVRNFGLVVDGSGVGDGLVRLGRSSNNGLRLLVSGSGGGSSQFDNNAMVRLSSLFQSDGSQDFATLLHTDSTLLGASGDTDHLSGVFLDARITTQMATEDITDISQLRIGAPVLTTNLTGSIINAQTLLIEGEPTGAVSTNRYALRIISGEAFLGGTTTTFGRIKTVTRQTTTYTILVTDSVVFGNTDSAGFTVTLPAGVSGQTFKVINSGSSGNILTVTPDGSEDLLGVNSSFSLFDGEALDITFDSTDGWY